MEQNFCGNCGKQLKTDPAVPKNPVSQGFPNQGPTQKVNDFPSQASATKEQLLSPMSIQPQGEKPVAGGLNRYALLSLEFANWDQAISNASEPSLLILALGTHTQKLAQHLQDLSAETGVSKNGVVFAAFPHAPNLRESLDMALAACFPLLDEEFQFHTTWLKLKAGLDIETHETRNPLTSGYERSHALAGTLMMSEQAYHEVRPFRNMEAEHFATEKLYRLPALKNPAREQVQPNKSLNTLAPELEYYPNEASISNQPEQLTPKTWSSQTTHAADQSPSLNDNFSFMETPALEGPTPFNELSEPIEPLSAVETIVTFSEGSGRISHAPLQETKNNTKSSMDRDHEDALSALFPHDTPSMEHAVPAHLKINEPPITSAPIPRLAQDLVTDSLIQNIKLPPPAGQTPPTEHAQSRYEQSAAATPLSETSQNRSTPSFDIRYTAPVYSLSQANRTANLRYPQTIDALRNEFDNFLNKGNESRIWALCAADGLGKSNLIGMARNTVDAQNNRAIWFGGNSYRAFSKIPRPLGFWLDLLHNLLSIFPQGQMAALTRQQIQHFTSQALEETNHDQEETLLQFLSVDPPQEAELGTQSHEDKLKEFFVLLISTLCKRLPVILVMEDVMFADSASLEILAKLLTELPTQIPFGLVLTMSRDFYPQNKLLSSLQRHSYLELVIGNLDENETAHFLDQGPLNGNLRSLPPILINSLCRQSDGIPLWLEEALRLLYLRDIISVDPETQQFKTHENPRPSDLQLPESLTGLVQERLRYLSEPILYVLQLSSVLGERLPIPLLHALAQMSDEDFHQAMEQLIGQGFLLAEGSHTARFRHGLLWDIIYQQIDFDLRVQMHQLISETLENDFNRGYNVSTLLLAQHSEAGQLPNRALQYWHLSALWAAQIGQVTALNACMFHTLELMQHHSRQPLAKQEQAIRGIETMGTGNILENPALAKELLSWAYQCREASGDTRRCIELAGLLASACELQGYYQETLEYLNSALSQMDSEDHPVERATLEISQLECLVTMGRLEDAKALFQRLSPMLEDDLAVQECRLRTLLLLGQNDSNALVYVADEIDRLQHQDNVFGALLTLRLVQSMGMLQQGRYGQVTQLAEQLLSDIESLSEGEAEWFMAQWGLLALRYHLEMEDWNSASQLVLTVISKADSVHDYTTMLSAKIYSAIIAGKLSHFDQSRTLFEEAIESAATHRLAGVALEGWESLARLELELGNIEAAQTLVSQALEVALKPGIMQYRADVHLKLLQSEILMIQNRWKEAGKVLEDLWPKLVQAGWQPQIASCAKLIGDLYAGLARQQNDNIKALRQQTHKSIDFYVKSQAIWHHLQHPVQRIQLDRIVAEQQARFSRL